MLMHVVKNNCHCGEVGQFLSFKLDLSRSLNTGIVLVSLITAIHARTSLRRASTDSPNCFSELETQPGRAGCRHRLYQNTNMLVMPCLRVTANCKIACGTLEAILITNFYQIKEWHSVTSGFKLEPLGVQKGDEEYVSNFVHNNSKMRSILR